MRSGEQCECGGRMRVYCSRTIGMSRVRFLKCSNCDATDRESVGVDDLGRSILRNSTKPSTAFASVLPLPSVGYVEATLPQ